MKKIMLDSYVISFYLIHKYELKFNIGIENSETVSSSDNYLSSSKIRVHRFIILIGFQAGVKRPLFNFVSKRTDWPIVTDSFRSTVI